MKVQKQLLRTIFIIFSILAITACSSGNQHQTRQGGSKVDDMSEAKPFVQSLKEMTTIIDHKLLKESVILSAKELEISKVACTIRTSFNSYTFSYEENQPITSYEGLSELSNLKRVVIREGYDQTLIDELGKLPKLKELKLETYTNVDHTPLSKIKSLKKLFISKSYLENDSYWNTFPISTDIALSLMGFPLSETMDLAKQYPNLVELHAACTYDDLNRISTLKNLKILSIAINSEPVNSKAVSYPVLSELPNLEELYFDNPSSYDFGGTMKSLKKLIVSYYAPSETGDPLIASLEGLDAPNLKELTISTAFGLTEKDIQMPSLKGIEKSKKLTNLVVISLSLVDISALKEMTQLEILGLAENKIEDISALKEMTQLEILGLQNNKIEDISALGNLPNLKDLDCSYNQITDMSPLKNNTSLERLILRPNPLNREIVDEVLPTMTHLEEYQITEDLVRVILDN